MSFNPGNRPSFNSGHGVYEEFDPESKELSRKRSLVKPERSRLGQNHDHPQFHYAQLAQKQSGHLKIKPSTTGVDPQLAEEGNNALPLLHEDAEIPLMDMANTSSSAPLPERLPSRSEDLKGGKEVFGLNDEVSRTGPRFGKKSSQQVNRKVEKENDIYFWKIYAYAVTFWAPGPLLRLFGLKSKERQFAWREKIALITCILYIGAIVAFLTFGFTRTVCTVQGIRTEINKVPTEYLIINGRSYDLSNSQHPAAAGIGMGTNVLYPPVNAGGKDASFLFQNVNGNCKGLITAKESSNIPHNDDGDVAWYMPCRVFNQDGSSSPNTTEVYYNGWACHTSETAREAYYNLKVTGDVFFTWDDVRNSSRNLIVYSGNVLDLNLIDWIDKDQLDYPDFFNQLRDDKTYRGHDLSVVLTNGEDRQAARCLTEIIKVGVIDSETIGCLASSVVLYVSLIFILSVVIIKFLMACYYAWFVSRHQGLRTDDKSKAERNREIENWVDDPKAQGDIKTVPERARAGYITNKTNRQSVFVKSNNVSSLQPNDIGKYFDNPNSVSKTFKYTTMSTQAELLNRSKQKQANGVANVNGGGNRQSKLYLNEFQSSTDVFSNRPLSTINPFESYDDIQPKTLTTEINPNVIPQPPIEYQPFGVPLVHNINFITCYSEGEGEIRLTLDSVATSDYPNSHKLIMVVCDGLIKGSGNDRTTPEIVLDLMTDFSVPQDQVQPFSYVAVAQGSKRHNMAKVYSGFYKYNDETVSPEKQQRVPMVVVVKCGTPDEVGTPKPGNRGKRDSQIILMSLLQKIMFDERMTEFEFSLLNNVWMVTGLMLDFYETVLMVDADTSIFPDSIDHMISEMVKDPNIMGLCGETKISNKSESWVTAIQVFEYYISHHQAKAFETIFGGVTCLPGCFSMYRIKAPKGADGYWVPILANPDIVERYADNVTNTLHKKNLLLLGEDRFLTSLMLKTFPKRSQIFVAKAACKTTVPSKFKVLLSQRRRWINSTIHNLFELVLVKDLCGTFCFSMQFVIFIELVGTLVLPAAISFTIYVIIFAIVSTPTPVISLVLLAIIFGLPGLLIVVTVTSWSYVVYFFIYMLALPIWNFVLPAYSFWKADDFSWGETRMIAGSKKDQGHGAEDGEFNSSVITMKRWRDYERDFKMRDSGLQIPDATWDPYGHEKIDESS